MQLRNILAFTFLTIAAAAPTAGGGGGSNWHSVPENPPPSHGNPPSNGNPPPSNGNPPPSSGSPPPTTVNNSKTCQDQSQSSMCCTGSGSCALNLLSCNNVGAQLICGITVNLPVMRLDKRTNGGSENHNPGSSPPTGGNADGASCAQGQQPYCCNGAGVDCVALASCNSNQILFCPNVDADVL